MEIYIEEFLIQNILINLCLLRLVELTTKTRTSLIKLLLASTLGSAFSVLIVGYINNHLIMNLTKFLCATVMTISAFKQSFKQFVFNFILLFLYTFAMNGAITSLSSCTYYTSFGYITATKLNLEAISSIIIISTYFFELIAKQLKYRLKTNNYIYKISITQNNHTLNLNAYLDSGNLMKFCDKPVIVLDINSYLQLTKTNLLDFCLAKSENINTTTVTGSNSLKIFTVDKVTFKKNKKNYCLTNQYVAVTTNNSFKNTNYKALLSPLMF